MSMNHTKAVAVRRRQREALSIRTADNDQEPAKKTTGPDRPKREARTPRASITLAPMPIGKIDE
jgi:hypothetical protein